MLISHHHNLITSINQKLVVTDINQSLENIKINVYIVKMCNHKVSLVLLIVYRKNTFPQGGLVVNRRAYAGQVTGSNPGRC